MNSNARLVLAGTLLPLCLLLTGSASAQTIVVDTANDVTDFGGARQVADLPGPDGKVSLPEAGLASDNTPGVQTIAFHIPPGEWTYQWMFPGRAVLKPFLGFHVFDTAIVDATTQTAFTGDTNPAGGEVVIWASTYLIDNVGGVMRGFDNTSISVSGGSGNVIQGNTQASIEIYDSPFTLIGGTNPGEGNTAGTIKIDRSSHDTVVGNTTTRVRVLGWFGGGQPAVGNRIGGPTLAERNFITGYGTWSEGCPGGTTVQIFDSIGTIIENNWIGMTPDGLAQGSLASTQGIGFEGENHDALIVGNRIAGILGHGTGPHCVGWLVGSGIDIYGIGSGIRLIGNTIGLNANDEPVLGSVTGVATRNYYLGTVEDVVIGGAEEAEGNVIAGHLAQGISVSNTYSGVRITGNSIHDNGALGIDLIDDGLQTGLTPNDALDADTGGNELQNSPVLQSADHVGSALRVVGSLNSGPSSGFTLEFFASPQCDGSGPGEGQQPLGFTTVSTDPSGNAAFDVTLPVPVAASWFVTATASATATGSTSEFSACVPVSGGNSPWTDLGQGLAGVAGIPVLAGMGPLSAGSPGTLALTNAAPASLAVLFTSLSSSPANFKCGTLVPVPVMLQVPLFTNAGGSIPLGWTSWPGSLSGANLYLQYAVADAAAVCGVSISNALRADVP
jgi:hypothetical protein